MTNLTDKKLKMDESRVNHQETNKFLQIIFMILSHFSLETSQRRQATITEIFKIKKLLKIGDEEILRSLEYFKFLNFYSIEKTGDIWFTAFSKHELEQKLLDYAISTISFSIPITSSLTQTELILSEISGEIVKVTPGQQFTFQMNRFQSVILLLSSDISPTLKLDSYLDIPWSRSDKVIKFNLESQSTILELSQTFSKLSPLHTVSLQDDYSGHVIFKNDVGTVSVKTSKFLGLKDSSGNEIVVSKVNSLEALLYETVWEGKKKSEKSKSGEMPRVSRKKARKDVKKVTTRKGSRVGKKVKARVDVDALMESFAKV